MLKKIKDFLEKNKVFFEIFSSVILGTMGIIISITTVKVTKYQNLLAEQELLPIMEVKEYLQKSEDKIYPESIIQISNIGSALSGFQSEKICILNIDYITDDCKAGNIKKELDGYYSYCITSQSSTGLLMAIQGYNNYYNFHNLESKVIEQKYKENGLSYLNIEVETYLKLEYYDVLNKKHTECYKLTGFTEKIEEQEYESIFQKYRSNSNVFKLETYNLEKILEYVKNDIEKH